MGGYLTHLGRLQMAGILFQVKREKDEKLEDGEPLEFKQIKLENINE